jgi:protein-S-isoprenylcysteine O-methyltransferase Ste14
MTPVISKSIFALLAIGWYLIRYRHARRSRRTPILRSDRSTRENILLLISLTGLGLVPLTYIATGAPHFANYVLRSGQAWVGLFLSISALMIFYLTHKALGCYWSVSLDVRQGHLLVTDGIYSKVRHPMYSAFWLWALSQALLLPNWVAGFSGIVGFGLLYFGRVAREERMMLDAFGDRYRDYMTRTSRIIPPIF